eukprot:gnl/TRDRNA2_/TRDRNA2_174096_c1_seq6.p1 gnl/TRDRNA2_/TRDRNA2_174096_c1~~gnl/TRDRNA2_/TRDRNA2_174096_c1_seq6.p1  ORF type:complete len:258 (-),score=62.55 gnl/TRDRNA2_/TRDRNA2_174096_c1_seq6:62-835(-)
MFRLAVCLALLAAAHAGQSGSLRAEGFVRSLEFKHRLRVCNAYPYNAALDVYRGKSEKLTSDGAMPYKTCKDFSTPLKAGDKLEFKVGDASAGTFSVSDLPNNDAVLMLVIHRHDTLSTAVSFESHVFANLLNAQIAIIDTYKGRARSAARIMDAKDSKHARSEELRYDSVVAVNPGTYEVLLAGEDGSTKAKDQLVALNRESYVVLRTGVEAQQGPVYPQELVVYPKSVEPKKAGAATTTVMLAPLLIAAAATLGF